MTAYDLTALYTSRTAAVRRFLGLEAVVLAAAVLVTALLARQMTRPLQILRTASAEIAGGDYDRRTALHTGDELENVSQSFDKMADAVQEKIADLQVDVQRREDFIGRVRPRAEDADDLDHRLRRYAAHLADRPRRAARGRRGHLPREPPPGGAELQAAVAAVH